MAEGGVSRSCDEQERLGQSVKTQQKYGTTTKTPSSAASTDLYVKHFVQKDETLPGIALKYGRSVQQLKSVNHLWSDWQLGVCEFILIPVSAADEHCPHTQTTAVNNVEAQSSTAPCELVTRHELVARNKLPKSASVGRIVTDDTESKTVSSDVQQTNSISVQDYFSKYDSSLAKIRQNVHRMEQTMNSRLDAQNPLSMLSCRRASSSSSSSSRHRHGSGASWNSHIETLDPLCEPDLRFSSDRNGFASNTSSTHSVQQQSKPYVLSPTACQRLQRTHDEMFQL